ncbi:MAG: hypothetical protein JWO67_3205 [Streptosporangiaceae bacterium]|nr:hypothetical protein [Streptosporangiaceae bacterium]
MPAPFAVPYTQAAVDGTILPPAFAGHLIITGALPTVAAGAANGTAPPAPTVTGNDTRGALGFGSGATPGAGAQVVVTFAGPYSVAPVVTVAAGNAATQALGLFVSAVTVNGFTLSSATAPTASQAATIYAAAFQVIG